MKLLKFSPLISAFTSPFAFSATSLLEYTGDSVNITSDTYLEASTVESAAYFPQSEARKLSSAKQTQLKLQTAPRFDAFLKSVNFSKSVTAATAVSALPQHQINCSQALNLEENNVYTDSISVIGEQHCYVMPLAQKSKVMGQLLANDAASDFNLYLYQYDPANNILTHVDSSEKAAGNIEQTFAVLPQASYILVAELKSGAGGSFNFVGNSYSNFDAQEPNDSDIVSKIPTVNVGQTVTGNLDNPADVDYFAFKLKASETEFKLHISGSDEHQVEFLNASSWQVLPHGQQLSAKGAAGATYYLRALAKPDTTSSTLNNYQIRSSNGSVRISGYDVYTTDRNLTDLIDYAATEAFSNLSASGTVLDSSGTPVVGERIAVVTAVNGEQIHKIVETNAQGKFNAAFDLPRCNGNTITGEFDSNFGTPRDVWRIEYKPKQKIIMYPLTKSGDKSAERSWEYIHICKETYVRRVTQ